MPVSVDFRGFVLEQLAGAGAGVTARAMFGGYGLYSEDKLLFGVLDDDAVFFRVDDDSRPAYESAGSRPFAPIPGQNPMRNYWELPADVLEDREALAAWRARALTAAARAAAQKGRKRGKAIAARGSAAPARGLRRGPR
jgi:DNA transformation protein and related proteins